MARGRIASKTKKKLNFLCYGDPFTGKSTFVSQFAYMHNEDGSPMKTLFIDAESGSIDLALDEMEKNGVDLRNIYILYTQSLGEVLDYIDKVKNGEDFYELDEDGVETNTVVVDAEGKPFRADAIVVDGVTVLHTAVQQGLLEFSKKRARVRADKNGLVGDEKLIAIEGSGLEIRDYGNIKYKGANLCLALLGSGVHSAITCRQEDEMVTVKDDKNQFNRVATGKKIPAGFKADLQYNVHTVLRFYRDENNEVMADVEKDRTGVHPEETLESPTMLDWQAIIDGNKGKSDFVLRNNLDTAVTTEQDIYSAEIMTNSSKSMSKSDMEKVKAYSASETSDNSTELDSIRAQIVSTRNALTPVKKSEAKKILEEKGLPLKYKEVTDAKILNEVLTLLKTF